MPPRKAKPQLPSAPPRTLVLDNGAYTIKAGYVPSFETTGLQPSDTNGDSSMTDVPAAISSYEPRIIPNCIARGADRKTYVGSELLSDNDPTQSVRMIDFGEMAFRRPAEKGYIVNWEAQREIWDREFFDDTATSLKCDPAETRLVLSEHSGNLPTLQTNCDQMVFEEFGFASYYRGNGAGFNAYNDIQFILGTPAADSTTTICPAEIMLLIDSGYSHTTITPLFKGRPLHQGVRRLDVGGKFLTNYLTRMLSLRHYDMRNDTHIVNEIKESACYVSLDFKSDLDKTWKGTHGERRESYLTGAGLAKDYVLPDFHTRAKGVVREYDPTQNARSRKLAAQLGETSEDVLTLRNERFTVPEILFNPSDVGLQQPGIADVVWQSLQALPIGLWPGLLANVIVVGGNALFSGFVERLQDEIVQRVPDECVVRVAPAQNPLTSTWHGAAQLAQHEHIKNLAVTKQEYEEHGGAWVARKFATSPLP
ncbi:actin-related protein 6 [Microdochium nivale]|nr:actin-related protein 6 [Microdochium nivale]